MYRKLHCNDLFFSWCTMHVVPFAPCFISFEPKICWFLHSSPYHNIIIFYTCIYIPSPYRFWYCLVKMFSIPTAPVLNWHDMIFSINNVVTINHSLACRSVSITTGEIPKRKLFQQFSYDPTEILNADQDGHARSHSLRLRSISSHSSESPPVKSPTPGKVMVVKAIPRPSTTRPGRYLVACFT